MSLQTVAAATYLILKSRKQKRRKRTIWCRQLFVNSDDKQNDLFNNLMADDGALFRNFTRMDKHDFDYLLNKAAPLIFKADTNFRCSILAKVKLYCTLRFLATGDSYRSLMYLFRISDSTISRFIPEVCRAIILVLKEYIKMPSTNDGWRDVSREFDVAWNFPHCIGCVDGKHVVMQNPNNAGSMYLNYKGTFSIVLMAVCDANYCFTFADAGIQGRISDRGAFRETTFFKKLEKNKLNVMQPYVILGDDAFALSEHLMKPFPGLQLDKDSRIYNYRLIRARRVIENTFGLMCSVFRVFRKAVLLNVENAKIVTLACCYLHNFLRKKSKSKKLYASPGSFDCERQDGSVIPGTWRNITQGDSGTLPLQRLLRRSAEGPKSIRDEFKAYFNTPGTLGRTITFRNVFN
nr:unnamed protein product [Callosobruchus analis]